MNLLRNDASPRGAKVGWFLALGVGGLAAWLVILGNPGNMGLCGACFLRDVAGSLGLLKAGAPRIFRPEIVGVMVGALALRLALGRYQARSGSHAVARLLFGALMGMGALVFLGCPFRMLQRLGGGVGDHAHHHLRGIGHHRQPGPARRARQHVQHHLGQGAPRRGRHLGQVTVMQEGDVYAPPLGQVGAGAQVNGRVKRGHLGQAFDGVLRRLGGQLQRHVATE